MTKRSFCSTLPGVALTLAALTLAPLSLTATAQAQDGGKPMALHCGKLYVGNGQVMTNVYLVIKDGKVDKLLRSRPENAEIIDASDKVVMPGIVAAGSDLSGHADGKYNVTPDFVAL